MSRIVRECCEVYTKGVSRNEDVKIVERSLETRQQKLNEALEEERSNLKQIVSEIETWRRKDSQLTEKIAKSKAERDNLIASTSDPLRIRNTIFRRKKMRAITRRASLVRNIRENLEALLDLKSRLEVSKLRTYPTLKLRY